MSEPKIASYNIYDGINSENIVNNVFNLVQKGANVVCLQEVRHPNGGRFIGDVLVDKLGSNWKAEFFLGSGPGNFDHGLGILWKKDELESINFQTFSFSKLDSLVFYESWIQQAQDKLSKPIKRGVLIGDFKINGKTLRISNLHLDWAGFSHRTRQLSELSDFLKKLSAVDADIICGDFNTVGFFGFRRKVAELEKVLGSQFKNFFPKFEYTTSHYQHLDYIFGRNLMVNQTQILKLAGSDHYPIFAHLSFV